MRGRRHGRGNSGGKGLAESSNRNMHVGARHAVPANNIERARGHTSPPFLKGGKDPLLLTPVGSPALFGGTQDPPILGKPQNDDSY
jgi:hypothetical protein